MPTASFTITRPPLITTKDAGFLTGHDERTVRRWCEAGVIRAVKVGTRWHVNVAALAEQFGLDNLVVVA